MRDCWIEEARRMCRVYPAKCIEYVRMLSRALDALAAKDAEILDLWGLVAKYADANAETLDEWRRRGVAQANKAMGEILSQKDAEITLQRVEIEAREQIQARLIRERDRAEAERDELRADRKTLLGLLRRALDYVPGAVTRGSDFVPPTKGEVDAMGLHGEIRAALAERKNDGA